MRIIAGAARGTKLLAPRGLATRPTADRVKESLFNILGGKVATARVLDIFAGTGSLGLEALSRGAATALFADRATAKTIAANAERTHLAARTEIIPQDVFKVLAKLTATERQFDLVFADPPYHMDLALRVLNFFENAAKLLAPTGLLILEHEAVGLNLPELKNFICVDRRRYGAVTELSFWRRVADE
ncbi:MAG: 16S rRNA (guanine(966)-N(2))-methyltransferase RsmD [Selenomonadaceae bacterium]|nr:16S rRNA (guanine(966)-N(2))-methyltransferase RsmD [Selenomonadaceae bacterium]